MLRSNVTKLVEDVRASVADLRNAPGPTLTARILQATAGAVGSPALSGAVEAVQTGRTIAATGRPERAGSAGAGAAASAAASNATPPRPFDTRSPLRAISYASTFV